MSIIKIRDRNNIRVYNTCASRVCLKGFSGKDYNFEASENGNYSMFPMPFSDIEYANSRNPDLFPTGILSFDESERDEIYEALNHPDWKDRIWTDETIEDALLHPTKTKLDRILAVRDILTIERIRGIMTKLINSKSKRPIDRVVDLVNDRFNELFTGKKVSKIIVVLPDALEKENAENKALKVKNAAMEEKLRKMEEQIAALMAAQKASIPAPAEKKPAGRPKKAE